MGCPTLSGGFLSLGGKSYTGWDVFHWVGCSLLGGKPYIGGMSWVWWNVLCSHAEALESHKCMQRERREFWELPSLWLSEMGGKDGSLFPPG